ncbi:MAG TPA: hypothetical protein VFY34_17230, partial [Pyrinomonadaceae bacterium]|nr:hypothetical protein [Pyrinomonadaceae bacterium]
LKDGYIHRIERSVTIDGPLTDEQRARLHEIAGKCPVHKTLLSPIVIAEWKESLDAELVDSEPENFF